jgi:hypothetical protein
MLCGAEIQNQIQELSVFGGFFCVGAVPPIYKPSDEWKSLLQKTELLYCTTIYLQYVVQCSTTEHPYAFIHQLTRPGRSETRTRSISAGGMANSPSLFPTSPRNGIFPQSPSLTIISSYSLKLFLIILAFVPELLPRPSKLDPASKAYRETLRSPE